MRCLGCRSEHAFEMTDRVVAIAARSSRMRMIGLSCRCFLTLGAHAQRGLPYLVCVCVSVCLSVYDYSRTTGYEAAYERYQQL